MNLERFGKTWGAIKGENAFYRYVVGGLVIALLSTFGFIASRDQVVVLVPPNIPEEMQVARKHGSSGYKKSWALYVAILAGNVNHGNADLIVEEVSRMMAPNVLMGFRAALAQQLEVIRKNGIAVFFEATQIYFEPETDKVFVLGKSEISGSAAKSSRYNRVFEIEVDVNDYSPVITFLETYEGDPRTLAWKERQAKREERQARRDAQ